MNPLKKMKQSFQVSKKKAIEKVEMATAFEKDDWILTMEICNEAKKCPTYYCGIIIERINDHNREVALKALNLLEVCVRNCGMRFREYMAKDTMVQRLYRIMTGDNPEVVKKALYLSIKEWSFNEFANVPKLILIPVLHYKLHPLWEGEKDECKADGRPPLNNLNLKDIMGTPQANSIFKIFDDVDKVHRNVGKTTERSQSTSSSHNIDKKQIYLDEQNAYLDELQSKMTLKSQSSDSESYDDKSDEKDQVQKEKTKSVYNQAIPAAPEKYLSELKLNLGVGCKKTNSESTDDESDEEFQEALQMSFKDFESIPNTNQEASSSTDSPHLTELKSKFECKICFEYMSPPIFICGNGHSVCGNCKEKIESCALCRAPILSRNFDLEELAQTFKHLET